MVRAMNEEIENTDDEAAVDTAADEHQNKKTVLSINTESATETDIEPKGERIAKVLARVGIGSRRAVERIIEAGRVSLDGKILTTPAVLVTSLKGIVVDGNPVGEVAETKLWRFHKRKGTLTTYHDPQGRPTVFENLPAHMGRVISVGRLDMSTEGLLLLTNDGELARWLELPDTGLVRRYRVRVHGRVSTASLAQLKKGITIEGVRYNKIEAILDRQTGANAWLNVSITEGKNREVRKVMEHLGLTVNRLIRTNYGPFTLGTLPDEGSAQVTSKQLRDVIPEFFGMRKGSAGETEKKTDKSKWAKAKKKPGVKPGDKRRTQFKAEQRRRIDGDDKGYKSKSSDKPFDKPDKVRVRPVSSRRAESEDREAAQKKAAQKRAADKTANKKPQNKPTNKPTNKR